MATARTTVMRGQSIWDLAIQEHGSIEGVFALLADNPEVDGLNAVLVPGQRLRVVAPPVDRDVRAYYQGNDLHPASGDTITEASGDWNEDWNDDFN